MTVAISPMRALLNVETSTPLPRLSSAMMLDAPENREIRDIWLLPPDNPNLHAGRKVAVVATDGVEEIDERCGPLCGSFACARRILY